MPQWRNISDIDICRQRELDFGRAIPCLAYVNAEPSLSVYCRSIGTAGSHSARGGVVVRSAPNGEGWLHEIKHDGHRLAAILDGRGGLKLISGKGYDRAERLREGRLRCLPPRGASVPEFPLRLGLSPRVKAIRCSINSSRRRSDMAGLSVEPTSFA